MKSEGVREATKHQAAAQRLIDLAGRLGPGAKLPRFLELRAELDVGSATLAAVLKDLEGRGVIERRHGVGIYVSERLNHRSVVMLCDPAFFSGGEVSPFWDMLLRHARDGAAERSADLTVHFAPTGARRGKAEEVPVPEPLAREIAAGRVHGVLGVGLDALAARWFESQGLPFVAFAGYGASAVAFDDAALVRLGVTALASRGCRRLALWSSVVAHGIPPSREEVLRRPAVAAFPEALKACGLPFEPELVRTNAHLCPEEPLRECGQEWSIPSQQEQGRRAARAVFGPDADPRLRPDGIVCTDDSMTQGALPQLARYGVGIGSEVQIATHANAGSPVLFGYEELLVRLEVAPALLVRAMYDRLEAQIEGRAPEVPQVSLPPVLRLPEAEALSPGS